MLVAKALGIGAKTVRVHRARLLEKMVMRDNAEPIHHGIRHELAEWALRAEQAAMVKSA